MEKSANSLIKSISQNPTILLQTLIYGALLIILASWQKLGFIETGGFVWILYSLI